MKNIIKLLVVTVLSTIISFNASAATGTFGCNNPGFVTLPNAAPPGDISGAINTAPNLFALVLIDGLYCAILGPTAGETALIRSMALQAYESGNKLHMSFDPVTGNVEAYTTLP